MRPYRGKRLDNDEWVYGFYVKVLDKEGDDIDLICSPDTSYARIDGEWYLGDSTEVDWKTVSRCTGIKDKKKELTEVYEGDILGENGSVKGNIHEAPELLEEGTNIVIANMGTDEWRDSEQEAIRRGCSYAQ